VRLWDSQAGTLLATLEGYSSSVTSVAFSPDGQVLASVSNDRTVCLWDSQARTLLATLEGHSSWVNSVAFSPDGQRLASASADMTVCLWDSQAGTLLATLQGHLSWVTSVAFSPDGQRLASASDDSTVRLWDSQTGTSLATLEGESTFLFFADSASFYAHLTKHSPTASGFVRATLIDHLLSPIVSPICWFPSNWQVSNVSFDPTFSLVAVGCKSGKVYILDVSEVLKNLTDF
jgi:WD40 repeat protein